MAVLTEGTYIGDVLKYEMPLLYSREKLTVLAGSGTAREIKAGTVVAKITASGKVVQFNQDGDDGSENAIGIAVYDVTAPVGTDAVGVFVVRGAIVEQSSLIWPAGIETAEITAAITELQALNPPILVRKGA